MPPGRSTRSADFERRLRAERLDRDIDAAAVGDAHDLLDRIDLGEVDDVVGAELARDGKAAPATRSTAMMVVAPLSFAPTVRTEPDRALREDRDRVADADPGRSRRR